MIYYLDTSVIVPFNAPEKVSTKVEQFITQQNDLPISDELVGAFVSVVAKKMRMKEMPLVDAKRITVSFQSHIDDSYDYKFSLDPAHFKTARVHLNRFDLILSTHDALHLIIVMLGNPTIGTFDNSLHKTGKNIGISTIHM